MIAILLWLVAVVLLGIAVARKPRRSLPLPPGPTPLPFIGNVLGINKDEPHLTFTAWSKTYGDIVHMRLLGQDLIHLNSEHVANALLEKRSHKYSDRAVMSLARLFGTEWTSSSARYGPRFRLHRRLLHQSFHAKAALGYRDRQLQKAYELLTHLLNDPTRYSEHFTTVVSLMYRLSASVIMEVTYGYDIKGGETFLTSMQRCADILLGVASPKLITLCNALPFVMVLPAWLPGMGWKSGASECRRLAYDGLNTPFTWVKQRIEEGNAKPSMVSDAITRYRLNDDFSNPELVQAIKESAATLYAASVKSTHATLVIFIYLMMNHPEVQRRAQADIDRVVGRQRLPDFEDRLLLPYVDAVMRETMRLHPVLPMGAPHATTKDDVYDGYYIPQGTIVQPNIWAISHNEEKYPNPDTFMPERFLKEDGSLNEDNVPWTFGFGRRICPGRHVADASLWSAIACILALFRIEKTKGSKNVQWTTGFTRHPYTFPCEFIPRDGEMDTSKLASLIYASRVDL